ncbi:MAG: hypothetical protein CYPHOPRED_003441 [Cyphobasidiales sp. Tagirdzhanova-0007]|nr:MAG: hypothetical protein CYPHOPRED_003441 [Cyphobasidiales sp. Tagirdzhanova-0007]
MTSLSAVPSNQDVFTIGPSTLVVDGLRISLLSLEDGKERIADVASGLAKAITAGFLGKEDVTVNLMQEKLYSSLCPEPELLIVLGGLHLRLRGFPPWHIRLSEIYHDSSLGLLGPPRLRYTAFQRAMNAYAGSEQRQGR